MRQALRRPHAGAARFPPLCTDPAPPPREACAGFQLSFLIPNKSRKNPLRKPGLLQTTTFIGKTILSGSPGDAARRAPSAFHAQETHYNDRRCGDDHQHLRRQKAGHQDTDAKADGGKCHRSDSREHAHPFIPCVRTHSGLFRHSGPFRPEGMIDTTVYERSIFLFMTEGEECIPMHSSPSVSKSVFRASPVFCCLAAAKAAFFTSLRLCVLPIPFHRFPSTERKDG